MTNPTRQVNVATKPLATLLAQTAQPSSIGTWLSVLTAVQVNSDGDPATTADYASQNTAELLRLLSDGFYNFHEVLEGSAQAAALDVAGTLEVDGASTLTGAVSCGSTLGVTGLATLSAGADFASQALVNGGAIGAASLTLTGNATLNSANPTVTVGSGGGTSILELAASDAGQAILDFKGGSAGPGLYWRIKSDTAENLLFQRYANGVFQGTPISLSTASDDVSFAADLTLNSASPTLTVGDGGGSPGIVVDADTTGIGFLEYHADSVRMWRVGNYSDDSFRILRGAGLANNLVVSQSTGLWSLYNDLTLNSASPVLTVGNGTGQPALKLDGVNGSQSQLWWSAGGNVRWTAVRNSTTDDWLLNRYTGASVFQDTPIAVDNADGSVSMPNPLYLAGAASGDGVTGSSAQVIGSGSGPSGITFHENAADTGGNGIAWSSDGAGTVDGRIEYDLSNHRFFFRANGSNRITMITTAIYPGSSGVQRLGIPSTGWGRLYLAEDSAAEGPNAGIGELWLKNNAPNTLYFTDDAGKDHPLSLMPTVHLYADNGYAPGTGGATPGLSGANVRRLRFADAATQTYYWNGTWPREYSGNGVTVRIWFTGDAGAAGNVRWTIYFERHETSTPFNLGTASWGTGTANDAAGPTVVDALTYVDIALANGADIDNLLAGEPFRFRLERLGGHGNDTFAGNTDVLGVQIIENP